MQITSLEQMEEIVAKSKSLDWDGWTVVNYYQSETGWSKVNGVYRNGRWYVANRFEPNSNGWNIPDRFVSKYAQK